MPRRDAGRSRLARLPGEKSPAHDLAGHPHHEMRAVLRRAPEENARGRQVMALHPQVAALLERAAKSPLPQYYDVPPAVARRLFRDTRRALTPEPPAVETAVPVPRPPPPRPLPG